MIHYNNLKNLFRIVILFCLLFPTESFGQCGTPVLGTTTNITPTSANVLFGCNSCTGNYSQILEWGPKGFTPGTAANAGPQGTVATFATYTTSYTINNLTPETEYDYYQRLNCNGTFTANTSSRTLTTGPACDSAISITCGSSVTATVTPGNGAWTTCTYGYAKEKVYSFTPTVSGTFYIVCQNPSTTTYFAYKNALSPCDGTGWNCIGYAISNNIVQVPFGPLTAGTTYRILLDWNSVPTNQSTTFRIECPICPQPTNVTLSSATSTSLTINYSGNAHILEYGPHGFLPGAGSTAGTSGTVIGVWGGSATINGLQPSTNYDIYLRSICGGNDYSPNSILFSSTTPPCPYNLGNIPMNTWMNVSSSQTGYYDYFPGCNNYTPGQEYLMNFTAPTAGNYILQVGSGLGSAFNFGMRPHQSNCDLSTFSCLSNPTNNNGYYYYTFGPLTAGSTYDFVVDLEDTIWTGYGVAFRFLCPSPSALSASNIGPNSVNLNWTCNCPNTSILEYGPSGFTPGTGATPGTNGTIISNITSPYTLSGLTSDTKYDVYFRSNCGGNFSSNTPVLNIRTSVDCSTVPVLSCNSYFSFQIFASGPNPIGGAWNSNACGNTNYQSHEGVWRFTPTVTGTYSLFNYAMFANSYNYIYPMSVYLKTASLGCNESNWNCMGTRSEASISFTQGSVSLGTLTAGITYLIMMDGIQPTFTGGYTYYFRLDCPNMCAYPLLSYISNITQTTATVNVGCNSCFGNIVVEYGPAGFTPGTNANPGTNGTVQTVGTFPYTITGLQGSTAYDVYARQNCGGGIFSSNAPKLSFTTVACNVDPSYITYNTPSTTICSGSSITLTQNGGTPASGGVMKWYSGSCGGTFVGSGNSITVNPTVTTTYLVRAEASCGNTICKSITITTTALPTAAITASGPVTFCAGNNVVLNANTGTGLTYQWKKYANNLAGATTASYTASGTGKYKCVVTNSAGCTKNSNVIDVTSNPLPTATITAAGPTTFCAGGSVVLNANIGTGLTYQWKKYANNIGGAINSAYTATTAGKYKCTVTNSNGCSKSSNAITVNVPCRVAGVSEKTFSMYPNPANDLLFIQTENSEINSLILEIKDLSGKVVLVSEINEEVSEIDIHNIAPGIYITSLYNQNVNFVQKLVIN